MGKATWLHSVLEQTLKPQSSIALCWSDSSQQWVVLVHGRAQDNAGHLSNLPSLFGMFAKHRERLIRPPGQGSPD